MEEKVFELEKRLEKLERKEKIRKTIAFIKVGAVILLLSIVFITGYRFYKKVNDTIKPIKDIIETKENAENKIDKIKNIFK
ncbi:MAG: hypothetical protein IKE10_00585 [Bacilli bacterium]|nr:hypothetical protein [Bacilli bacterium]